MGNTQGSNGDNIVITRRDASPLLTSNPSKSPAEKDKRLSTLPTLSSNLSQSTDKPAHNLPLKPADTPPDSQSHPKRPTTRESEYSPPSKLERKPSKFFFNAGATDSTLSGLSPVSPPQNLKSNVGSNEQVKETGRTEEKNRADAKSTFSQSKANRRSVMCDSGNVAVSGPMEEEQQTLFTGITRNRGNTVAGFTSFLPIPENEPQKLSLKTDGEGKVDKKKKRKLDKETKDKIAAVLQSTIELERKDERSELFRNRSNSMSGFEVDPETKARQAAIIIAALKRVSQRLEQNKRDKAAQEKAAPPVLSETDKAAIKIQSTFRRWVAMKKYKRRVQRTNVVREILITELDYVRFLSVLVKVYYYPLRKANIMSPEEIMAIFPQVEIIKIYNSKFVEMLQNKMREWSCYQTIGDVFVSMVDFMREPYSIYISQFPEISEMITTCSRRLPVAHFLKKCTKFTEVASMDLLSLASMPFQRIPRYMLLLKECLKYTDRDHQDYELIRVAVKKLDSLTQAASERLRMSESTKSVMRVSAILSPPVANLVRPYRKLIRDGTIDAQFVPPMGKQKEHPQMKNCWLFLFNDCVLLAKPYKRSFFDSGPELKLKPVEIMDLRGAVLLDVTHPKNEFRVRVQTGTAILQTKNWPEKEAWRSDIMDTIILLREEEGSASNHSSSSLGRSMSVQISPELPVVHEKLVRTRSQITPSFQEKSPVPSVPSKPKTPSPTLSTVRQPRRLTRQFTLPQIGDLFSGNKFSAPKKEEAKRRVVIGRAPSYDSFFLVKGTTRRKNKVSSALPQKVQELRKSQSLNVIQPPSLSSSPTLRPASFLLPSL